MRMCTRTLIHCRYTHTHTHGPQMGYLHYCKAGCVMNAKESSMSDVIKSHEDARTIYNTAEDFYARALNLYTEIGGEVCVHA